MMDFKFFEGRNLLCELGALGCRLAKGRQIKDAFMTTFTYERRLCCSHNILPRDSDAES